MLVSEGYCKRLPICCTVSTDDMQVLLDFPPLVLGLVWYAPAYRIRRSVRLLQMDLASGDQGSGTRSAR